MRPPAPSAHRCQSRRSAPRRLVCRRRVGRRPDPLTAMSGAPWWSVALTAITGTWIGHFLEYVRVAGWHTATSEMTSSVHLYFFPAGVALVAALSGCALLARRAWTRLGRRLRAAEMGLRRPPSDPVQAPSAATSKGLGRFAVGRPHRAAASDMDGSGEPRGRRRRPPVTTVGRAGGCALAGPCGPSRGRPDPGRDLRTRARILSPAARSGGGPGDDRRPPVAAPSGFLPAPGRARRAVGSRRSLGGAAMEPAATRRRLGRPHIWLRPAHRARRRPRPSGPFARHPDVYPPLSLRLNPPRSVRRTL